MRRSDHSKPGRRGPGLALGALLLIALGALAPAAQAKPPRISERPVVAGTPVVGSTVQASGAKWDGSPPPTVTWQWMRCAEDSGDDDDCRAIPGATAITYTVSEADLGARLRVLLTVRNKDGWAWALSAESAEVAPAPPPPPPPPAPSPSPSPSPSPEPAPSPAPAPAAPVPDRVEVLDESAARPPTMMRPAPLVRIRGRLTRSGARITLLTVRAPRGARISVRCLGRGCPARRVARTASVTRIARFERALPGGTRLIVTVTKRGRIGKHTAIAIRRGKPPTRRDRCLMPGARKPVACPAV